MPKIVLCSLFIFFNLFGQTDLYWENNKLNKLTKNKWQTTQTKQDKEQTIINIHYPYKLENIIRYNEIFWATAFTRTPQKGKPDLRTLSLVQSKDGKKWEIFVKFIYNSNPIHPKPSYFLPLDDKKALGISSALGYFYNEKSTSKFAIFRRNEHDGVFVLTLDHILEMGLKESKNDRNPLEHFGSFFSVQIRPIPQGWALVHPRSGLTWAYWLEEGRLRHRLTAVYPRIMEDLANGTPFETALLAVHPQADGSLLAAARSEAATLVTHPATQGRQDIPDLPQGIPLTAEGVLKHLRDVGPILDRVHEDQERRHWRDFPELRWFRIDPKAGKAEEVLPEGAPTRLPPEPPFSFTLDARGRVVLERPAPAASDGPEAQGRP